VAQRQFSSIRNEYEVTFDANSHIEEAQDEGNIQVAVYNFKKVRSVRVRCPYACRLPRVGGWVGGWV
jgi:hypothetical protein